MKKIILLVFLAVAGFASKAQVVTASLYSQYGNLEDTVTNTGTNYLLLQSTAAVKAYYKTALVVFKAVKISGTIAGTAIPQISANGVDFADMPGATAFTLTDVATQSAAWTVSTGWAGIKIRIKVTGTGSMAGKIYGSTVFKQ